MVRRNIEEVNLKNYNKLNTIKSVRRESHIHYKTAINALPVES